MAWIECETHLDGMRVSRSIPLARTTSCNMVRMPVITLPDGSQKQFDHAVSVADIAAGIGPGLAKAALAGKVNGRLVDTSTLIDHDAAVSIVTDKDPDGPRDHPPLHRAPAGERGPGALSRTRRSPSVR